MEAGIKAEQDKKEIGGFAVFELAKEAERAEQDRKRVSDWDGCILIRYRGRD